MYDGGAWNVRLPRWGRRLLGGRSPGNRHGFATGLLEFEDGAVLELELAGKLVPLTHFEAYHAFLLGNPVALLGGAVMNAEVPSLPPLHDPPKFKISIQWLGRLWWERGGGNLLGRCTRGRFEWAGSSVARILANGRQGRPG